MDLDHWHELLSNRYVCEICMTRYFTPQRRCRACGLGDHVVPLGQFLNAYARNEQELREIIAAGQNILSIEEQQAVGLLPQDPPNPNHQA